MRVYRWKADLERYALLDCGDDAIRYLDQGQFNGEPLSDGWQPFEVWWDATSEGAVGDFPGFPEPVVSGRAVAALGDVLRRHGELLGLQAGAGEFFIYNVTNVVDCLDETASSGKRFSDGRFMWINRHAFDAAAIDGHEVFRIPQWRRGPNVYVTDAFCRRVEAADLRGFRPVEVWSQEQGPVWLQMT